MIRILQTKDLPTLIASFCFSWSTMDATQEKWHRYVQEAHRKVYLVEVEGRILGYASLLIPSSYPPFKKQEIPEINDLWIDPAWREKGLGKRMIFHLEGIAKEAGCTHIGLGVGLYRDYGAAQALYVSLGFVPDKEGITYKMTPVTPGESYPVDDDLVLWFKKRL